MAVVTLRDTYHVLEHDDASIQGREIYIRGQLHKRGRWYRAEYRERLGLGYRLVRGETIVDSCRDGERLAAVA